MVNLTSETLRIIQIIITIGIMVLLLACILFLDYFKKHEQKNFLYMMIGPLLLLLAAQIVIAVIEVIIVATSALEIILFVITLSILVITVVGVSQSEKLKITSNRTIFIVVLAIFYVTLIVIAILIWKNLSYDCLHLGSTLGLPALTLVTIGTLLVIYDEPKYVLYHGFSAGGAWIITLLNVILLFSLTEAMMRGYSGWIHALHIICGGIGLTFGFASALFGLSGQRKLAKVTGYTTLGCWWLAYLLGFFIQYAENLV